MQIYIYFKFAQNESRLNNTPSVKTTQLYLQSLNITKQTWRKDILGEFEATPTEIRDVCESEFINHILLINVDQRIRVEQLIDK